MRLKESSVNGGRVAVFAPGHPGANNRGYIPRARFRMEQRLGRLLEPHEHVHHIDEDPLNDDESNLEVLIKGDHTRRHFRKLDYDWIASLREQGLGYKRIAKITGYPRTSIQSACRLIESPQHGAESVST